MDATVTEADPYSWAADRRAEQERLVTQGAFLEPVSEPPLREAGLATARRVVDLGSGAADLALLAARLIGPEGEVLGVERSPEQAELARRRVAAMAVDNVAVVEGDVAGLDALLAALPEPVDAVIGRCILMWVPDRQSVLEACARRLPAGSLVWFHEPDLEYWESTHPQCPLWTQAHGWVVDTLRAVGAELRMGPGLHRAFRDAGLPAPTLRCQTAVSGAPDARLVIRVVGNVIRGMLPLIEQLGVATAAEVGVDTLEDRLHAEVTAVDGTVSFCPMHAAWARVPG